jgi:hypothetical protein
MNGYPHSKHAYQKTGAKYQHGPEALSATKQLYGNENNHPHANDADNRLIV